MIPTWNMKKGWTVYGPPRGTYPAPKLTDYHPTKQAAVAAAKKEKTDAQPAR